MRLLIIVAIASSAGPARAERAITVDVATLAPFEAADLARALRVRLPAQGIPVHVRVALTPTGIQVQARDATREVDIANLRGPAAARLVALAASDLLLDDLAAPPPAPTTDAPATFGAIGGVAGWDRMLGAGMLDVTVPLRGRTGAIDVVAIELGGGALSGGPVSLTAAVVRLGGGARAGIVEVRAGVTLAPIFVSAGVGDSTLLAGGGASLRVRLPVAARTRAVFGIGVDVFATQTEYRIGGMESFTTPRVAPWLGAGVEVTP